MYKINYDSETGQVNTIQKDETMSLPICDGNMDFQDFLKWNKAQKAPLDYKTPIKVEPPEPQETIEERLKKVEAELKKYKEKNG